MMITDIVPVTRQKYRILTDASISFVLYKGELSQYQLEKEKVLSDVQWMEIQQLLTKRAKLRAMHLLARMDYTQAELARKLAQGEYTEEAAAAAIEYVKSYHYLDDERYVDRYMKYAQTNKSRRQKEFELERKGISREQIRRWRDSQEEGTVCDAQEDEVEKILALLAKRCRTCESADGKEKRKQYAYLARKGFDSSDILRAFEQYFGSA